MAFSTLVQELRRSSRVQLSLPVRLRWQEALRQNIEVAETLDVSRTGLLFYRTAPRPVCSRVWVTHPYSPDDPTAQPEMPARVVRVKTTPGGGQLVAVEFEQPRRSVPAVGKFNRRAAERRPLSLPLSLWPAGAPWPEYAMTLDLSDGGVLIRTPTVYSVGDRVRVALTYGSWTRRGELEAEVVRVEPVPDSVEQRVALAFLHP